MTWVRDFRFLLIPLCVHHRHGEEREHIYLGFKANYRYYRIKCSRCGAKLRVEQETK